MGKGRAVTQKGPWREEMASADAKLWRMRLEESLPRRNVKSVTPAAEIEPAVLTAPDSGPARDWRCQLR